MTAATIPVPLPGGATWLQRATPDPVRFEQWRRALDKLAMVAANGQGDPHAQARERIALIAAYDAGWDVRGADGKVLPPPGDLSLHDWNTVPREVIEAMLDHLDAQASVGLAAFQSRSQGGSDGGQ